MGDVPATLEQLKAGVKVKCIYHYNNLYGKTGTVVNTSSLGNIEVKWDDGADYKTSWSYPHSFAIIDEASSSTLPDTTTNPPGQAVNDHICPHYLCDRVSKSEKTCWRCGGCL